MGVTTSGRSHRSTDHRKLVRRVKRCLRRCELREQLLDHGLTARQTATALARLGHHVEALAPDDLCLARFTRHVTRIHPVPKYGPDPFGWLDAALRVFRDGRFDVLFPTQEQVAVLAAVPDRLRDEGISTAVPAFSALRAVQDKASAFRTLNELGLPQPVGELVPTADALRAFPCLPAFVKTPIGTASGGVRLARDPAGAAAIAADYEGEGAFEHEGVVVQQPADGPLVMLQSVFADGELVAFHANLRVDEGANGGASQKRSIDLPDARETVERLGSSLGWHGALSADAILTTDGPLLIDINPRLVEPGNAARAGVDLVGALLDVAVTGSAEPQPAGRPGVRTHQALLSVLGAAGTGRRHAVLAELVAAASHRGGYQESAEELTPWRGDRRAALPLVAASLATLIHPPAWRWFASGSVENYALTDAGWRRILSFVDEQVPVA